MNNLLKLAQEFESELKKVDDLGDNLFISPPLVKDLVESLERTKANLDRCIPKIKSGTEKLKCSHISKAAVFFPSRL